MVLFSPAGQPVSLKKLNGAPVRVAPSPLKSVLGVTSPRLGSSTITTLELSVVPPVVVFTGVSNGNM